MKVAIVTNNPAPYRVPVFNLIKKFDLHVIYCCRMENNRSWDLSKFEYNSTFLVESYKENRDGYNYRHNNIDVIKSLQFIKPDIVITTGFNPTHIYSFIWTVFNKKRHICMTDGTIKSENGLSLLHKFIRKIFIFKSYSFIAASNGGIDLYRSYGVPSKKIFKSQLCANNDIFNLSKNFNEREYDLLYSGQFHERKLPKFFVQICIEISKLRKGKCKVLLIGDGPLRKSVIESLKSENIDYTYAGFVKQPMLPSYYASAKLLLFTTRMDPWGVVANESLAAGTPVITTPDAGVANEIVVNGLTGYICEPVLELWVSAILKLLSDENHWNFFSRNAKEIIKSYSYSNAATGIEEACMWALKNLDSRQ